MIGEDIFVSVMSVSGHSVRLGIEAPGGIPIYREEIWQAVRDENRAAAAEADADPVTSAARERGRAGGRVGRFAGAAQRARARAARPGEMHRFALSWRRLPLDRGPKPPVNLASRTVRHADIASPMGRMGLRKDEMSSWARSPEGDRLRPSRERGDVFQNAIHAICPRRPVQSGCCSRWCSRGPHGRARDRRLGGGSRRRSRSSPRARSRPKACPKTSTTSHKIQEAVEATKQGSWVLIEPGIYHEEVTIRARSTRTSTSAAWTATR